MSEKTILYKKTTVIILAVAILVLGLLALLSIDKLQGNARVINYTGIVRGATQKLIKQELEGHPNDALIERLDSIIAELRTGDGENGLIRLRDEEFQELMLQMQGQWQELKAEIGEVRRGKDSGRLYDLSEEYFDLADRTVLCVENYTEKNVHGAELLFIVISAVFTLAAGFVVWVGVRKDRQQQAMRRAAEENRRRSEQLQVPINEISELIYVSDMETHELLFVNDAGKESFHLDDIRGLKCYKAIQGNDEPCSFCTNPFLKPGETYSWEMTNPITNRHYMFRDRVIEWDGRRARLEIAFDMTLIEEEKQKLEFALNAENMIMECIRIMYQAHDLKSDLCTVLQNIGEYLQGGRTYLLQIKNNLFFNILEWCAPGVEPQKDNLQAIPTAFFDRWTESFERHECIIIENLEEYRESSPEEYRILAMQGITSLVIAPMEQDGVVVGAIGIDNPPAEKLLNIGPLLQTLCYFVLLANKRVEDEKQLSHMSFYDNLTGFYNRNRFMQDLDALSDAGGSAGIIYLDVNGLKEVNDKYGHAEGDRLLQRTAAKIRTVFGAADRYRVGGDEFVIIDRSPNQGKFLSRAETLRRSFGWDKDCRAAIGAEWTDDAHDINRIVSKADAMMYADKQEFYRKNKTAGRYRHRGDEVLALSDPAVLRDEITREQFVVYLQPKISSSDLKAVGAEALIRYKARDGALVLPGNFLPLLEEAESVGMVDFYVFELICRKISLWVGEGKKGFPVSVNFSRYSLVQPDFLERLKEICSRYDIPPSYLEIEFTESVKDVEGIDIGSLINGLRSEGFAVSIDDFGIEYTNLAMLSSVDFDVLKLDKTLIKDVSGNEKTRLIVRSAVDVCRLLGIRLVAEGVEEEEQLEALRSCGVELIQGYLFTHPIPIEEYEKQYL